MLLWQWQCWPLWLVCAGMIAAAIIDWWKFKVPNRLTFPLILSGWLLGLVHTCGLEVGGVGGIGAALAGTFLGLGLLLPIYSIGGMGAGDVKMTMGFGSWIGAFFGVGGLWIVVYSFCAGVLVGGLIALVMMIVRGQWRRNAEHTRAIVTDLLTASSLGSVAAKANQRRDRWHRLPYGVPLCIGFVGYLALCGQPTPEATGGTATTPQTAQAQISAAP
ncbi:MAG TPA: A24 family peptidase [Gemmataceae bacterium]|nr:A24 family peptidase [Gemmataceae bacterium]